MCLRRGSIQARFEVAVEVGRNPGQLDGGLGERGDVEGGDRAPLRQAQRDADAGVRDVAQDQPPGQAQPIVHFQQDVLRMALGLQPVLEQEVGQRVDLRREQAIDHERLGSDAGSTDHLDEQRFVKRRAGRRARTPGLACGSGSTAAAGEVPAVTPFRSRRRRRAPGTSQAEPRAVPAGIVSKSRVMITARAFALPGARASFDRFHGADRRELQGSPVCDPAARPAPICTRPWAVARNAVERLVSMRADVVRVPGRALRVEQQRHTVLAKLVAEGLDEAGLERAVQARLLRGK